MNVWIGEGFVGRDPVMFRKGESVIAETSIAISKDRKNKQTGQYETVTTWVDIKAFGHLAEFMEKNIVKGNRIWVTGELEEREWEDKVTKAKRSKIAVVAEKIQYGFNARMAGEYDKKKNAATQSTQTHADASPQQGGYANGEIPF